MADRIGTREARALAAAAASFVVLSSGCFAPAPSELRPEPPSRYEVDDDAIRDFVDDLTSAAETETETSRRFERTGERVAALAEPLVRAAEDGLLSRLGIAAGIVAERIARVEIARITAAPSLSNEEKHARLERLREMVEALSWLSRRAKGDIELDVVFAQADLRYGGSRER